MIDLNKYQLRKKDCDWSVDSLAGSCLECCFYVIKSKDIPGCCNILKRIEDAQEYPCGYGNMYHLELKEKPENHYENN